LLGASAITLLHITPSSGSAYDDLQFGHKSPALSLDNVMALTYEAVKKIRKSWKFPEIRFSNGLVI